MKFAVLRFPGSNCDQDCFHALRDELEQDVDYVWHKTDTLEGYDSIVVPGGFSYGDYLRCGAIARFSPVMRAVRLAVEEGRLVIGICNGFQILCECGLLPGALVRNRDLHFICEQTTLRVETSCSPFTGAFSAGELINLPIAHGEGCYTADDQTVQDLEANDQILFRYADGNPNGSRDRIAGICNRRRNVAGLMPHPDRACDSRLGSEDGQKIFRSMIETAVAL